MSNVVLYAMTEEGTKLPIIDVSNAAFTVAATDAELAVMSEQFVRESTQQREMPAPLREALRQSILGRALMAASGTFLAGMSTYLIKLGPDNLGVEMTPVDRSIAASFPAFTSRLASRTWRGCWPTVFCAPGPTTGGRCVWSTSEVARGRIVGTR